MLRHLHKRSNFSLIAKSSHFVSRQNPSTKNSCGIIWLGNDFPVANIVAFPGVGTRLVDVCLGAAVPLPFNRDMVLHKQDMLKYLLGGCRNINSRDINGELYISWREAGGEEK